MRAWMLLLAAACAGGEAGDDGANYPHAWAIRLVRPTNGETVEPRFTVEWEAAADVATALLEVDGAEVARVAGPQSNADRSLELEIGRHTLRVAALDAQGEERDAHEITIRVADPGASWVTISSPADGASVPTPVHLVANASEDVESIEFTANGESLGFADPGAVLTASLEAGATYEVEALAMVGSDVVATDSIEIAVTDGTEPGESAWNDVALAIVATYPTDGSYGYYWPSDGDWAGTTRDIWYRDTLVAEGDPEHRSYCVGLTWEVFMRTFETVDEETGGDGTLNGMTVDDLYEFRADWYVRELDGPGVAEAVENYGIGERITDWDRVRPGDAVQFWRHSGTGHSVYFIDWERDDDGSIAGFTYWSTQSSTEGIDYNTEYFGASGSAVDPSRTFFARVRMPEEWTAWH